MFHGKALQTAKRAVSAVDELGPFCLGFILSLLPLHRSLLLQITFLLFLISHLSFLALIS